MQCTLSGVFVMSTYLRSLCKVFSCFHVISAEAHNTLLGILEQAFADLTANGMNVHCLGISCIAV